MSLTESVGAYVEAVTSRTHASKPIGLMNMRNDLTFDLIRAMRDPTCRMDLVRTLDPARRAVIDWREREPRNSHAHFEDGAIDALLSLVKRDPVQMVRDDQRAVLSDPIALAILHGLKNGERRAADLAQLTEAGLDWPSALSTLVRVDLVFRSLPTSKNAIVRLTDDGEVLLDLVERGLIR